MLRSLLLSLTLLSAAVEAAPDPARIPHVFPDVQVMDALPRFFDGVSADFLADQKTLRITVRTTLATPPGILYYGHREDTGHNRYRFYAKEIVTENSDSKIHLFHMPIDDQDRNSLENPSYDVTGLGANGGVIGLRALFHNSRSSEPEQFDWEIRYRKNGAGERILSPGLDRGPYLDTFAPDHAAISMVLSQAATVTVDLAKLPCLEWSLHQSQMAIRPELHFHDLTPETSYCARVRVHNDDGSLTVLKQWHFKTFSASFNPIRFAVMSDSRSGHGGGDSKVQGTNYGSIVNLFNIAMQQGVDLVVFPGDLIDGYTSDLEHMKQSLRAFQRASGHFRHRIPMLTAMGNHEAYVEKFRVEKTYPRQPWKSNTFTIPKSAPFMEEVFAEEFVHPLNGPEPEGKRLPPYLENVYFTVLNGIAFVVLNTNYWYGHDPETLGGNLEGYIMDQQLQWMKKTYAALEQREDVRFIMTFFHEPAFPNSFHISNAMYYHNGDPARNGGIDRSYVIQRRDQVWGIISASPKSVAVFSGDEHNYSRMLVRSDKERGYTHDVWQIVTGGVGAPYYAQVTEVPWAHSVEKFRWDQHVVIIDASHSGIRLRAIDATGQTIDSKTLRKL